ncbi:VOC family protein [Halobacillus litoralis]|uniref:VOC domain-containing protein n=1 Tax=Halobacillus litoralis TaxID=45668 RepID=A0A410MI95_9BACI|nr:VOC family protein [Halobacillus litoralis]QAS54410.1 hypothetical protein HLI_20400 [Halobacillus litoralis]
MIERLDTVCLKVRDVIESSKWYEEKLGFTVSFEGEGYRVLSIGESSVPLTIEEGEVEAGRSKSYPIFYSKDIETTYKKLQSKGVQVSEIQNDDVNHFFDVYDQDGNRMQICFFSQNGEK